MNQDRIIISFPNYINRYSLVAGTIELDIFLLIASVGSFSFILTFLLATKVSLLGFLSSAFVTVVTAFLYSQYKAKNKKGFLLHWLYQRGLYYPHLKGYTGLPKNFLPEGWIREFRD